MNLTTFFLEFNATQYPFVPAGASTQYLANATWLRQASNLYGAINPDTRTPRQPMLWGGGGPIHIVSDAGPDARSAGVLMVGHRRLSPAFVGKWLVLEHSRAHTALSFLHCGDVQLQGITLFSNPGFGFMFQRCHNVLLDNVRIIASQDRPMSIMV